MILKRGRQSQGEIAEKSAAVVKRLLGLPEWKAAKTVMIYAATRSEVQTRAAIEAALGAKKRVCLPARITVEHDMEAYAVRSFDELLLGDLGFLEPPKRKSAFVAPRDIDLMVVPGVAFDESGNRLGRGFHYYDGFLKKTTAAIVALSFEMQIIPKVPIESHDMVVGKIVTEKRLIECKKAV